MPIRSNGSSKQESKMAAYSTMVVSESKGGRKGKRHLSEMRRMMGPGAVDQSIRMAISHCWMIMPPNKQNPAAVSKEIRRIVERALKNLEEDAKAFSIDR
jgi:hypothetical protein